MKDILTIINNNTLLVERFLYDDSEVVFHVVRKSLQPNLFGFIGQYEGMFFISEDVPTTWRIPQIVHEFVEMTVLSGMPGRCVRATKIELDFVSKNLPDDLRAYIDMRIVFFENLLRFYKNTGDPDVDALQEFEGSLQFLKSL